MTVGADPSMRACKPLSFDNRKENKKKSAIISPDGVYHYALKRRWASNDDKPILWVMLNPSTADAEIDDPTIRRCIAFSREWGYGSMIVCNKYAYRATDPYKLRALSLTEAVGPDNYAWLRRMVAQADCVVIAWGTHGGTTVPAVLRLAKDHAGAGNLWCLGRNRDGSPKHPLYLRHNQPLEPWEV